LTDPHIERQTIMKNWDIDGDGIPCPFPEFMEADHTTPSAVFDHWCSKYYEPPRREVNIVHGDVDTERIIVNLPPKVQQFIRRGPKNDRSAGMVALAHQLRQSGATPSEAYAILAHVDLAWGKGYADRVNGSTFLEDIVERAYG